MLTIDRADILIEDSGEGNATITPISPKGKRATQGEILEGKQKDLHQIFSWAVESGLTIHSNVVLAETDMPVEYKPIFETNFGGGFSNIDKINENADKNFEHLVTIDKLAKEKGQLLFRYFYLPVADGKAFYQITKVTKTRATVTLCTGISLDEWYDRTLGVKSSLPIAKVMQLVQSRQALEDLFSKKA